MSREKFLHLFRIDKLDLLLSVFVSLGFLVFTAFFTYFYFARDIKSEEALMNKKKTGVVLLDRKDRPFFTFWDARVTSDVLLADIPSYTQKAIIAIEDRDFFLHPGFSIKGILRSLIADVGVGNFRYGGSTITQQLIKNSLLTPRKDFLRKYQELILAKEVERRFTKDQILTMYLNSVYFGKGSFGVAEAAQNYFDKRVSELSLGESTYLAALLPAPSRLGRFAGGDDSGAKERQEMVLKKMVEQGFITPEQATQAIGEKLVFKSNQDKLNRFAPHFALMIKDQLLAQYGEEKVARSGFRVRTTIDLDWQKQAERVVSDQVVKLDRHRVTNAAAVVLDPKTGEIRALVGSADWNNDKWGKVNVALSPRQPGSAFKPIVYSLAFEQGVITPASVLHDEPITYKTAVGDYSPHDYDGQFRGEVLVRRALANSLNVPAVEMMSKVGVEKVIERAQALGLDTINDPSRFGLSLVLGSGEVKLLYMTNVYATLANSGKKNNPFGILQITNKYGDTIYETSQPQGKQVIDPRAAYMVTSILADNRARAEIFGNQLTISRPAAVKTGTTQSYKDAWTFGYTPNLAIGVWVGNNDGTQMDHVAGALGAAPIWRELMERFLADLPREQFSKPQGLIALGVCTNGGVTREATSSAYTDYFISGTAPKTPCIIPTPAPVETAQSGEEPAPSPSPTAPPALGGPVPDLKESPGQAKKEEKD